MKNLILNRKIQTKSPSYKPAASLRQPTPFRRAYSSDLRGIHRRRAAIKHKSQRCTEKKLYEPRARTARLFIAASVRSLVLYLQLSRARARAQIESP